MQRKNESFLHNFKNKRKLLNLPSIKTKKIRYKDKENHNVRNNNNSKKSLSRLTSKGVPIRLSKLQTLNKYKSLKKKSLRLDILKM